MVFGEVLSACAVIVHNLTKGKSSTFATYVCPVPKLLGHICRIYVGKNLIQDAQCRLKLCSRKYSGKRKWPLNTLLAAVDSTQNLVVTDVWVVSPPPRQVDLLFISGIIYLEVMSGPIKPIFPRETLQIAVMSPN